MNIPFSKVDCSGNEMKYLEEVLNSGWLTTASKCSLFEEKFLECIGAKYACAVNSATSALHLALEAIGVKNGDKIFVPTLTFTATAEVVRYLGADPVFLDVDYSTSLLSPEILEEGIFKYPDVRFLIIVHYAGQAAEMSSILRLCEKHEIRVIEDAAHAFPTKHMDKMIGTFSEATCFSFYANKTITTGEGGMLVTDNDDLFQRAKIMRLHGISRDIWDRFTANSTNWEYDVVAPGYKYNMPDVAAAIGLAQLERAEIFRKRRQECTEFYLDAFKDMECLDLPKFTSPYENHSHHLFWFILNDSSLVDRNGLIELLGQHGIGTSVHYKPLHRMKYYAERYRLDKRFFPNAEKIWKGTISLPIYYKLSDDELIYITTIIKEILRK